MDQRSTGFTHTHSILTPITRVLSGFILYIVIHIAWHILYQNVLPSRRIGTRRCCSIPAAWLNIPLDALSGIRLSNPNIPHTAVRRCSLRYPHCIPSGAASPHWRYSITYPPHNSGMKCFKWCPRKAEGRIFDFRRFNGILSRDAWIFPKFQLSGNIHLTGVDITLCKVISSWDFVSKFVSCRGNIDEKYKFAGGEFWTFGDLICLWCFL